MMKDCRRARWAALWLAGVMIWWLLGAPLTGAEWAALPQEGRMALKLLPQRMSRMLSGWLGPSAPEERVSVYDPAGAAVVSLPLHEYLTGVVAAEMPASYHLEALKSQAVAARTRLASQGCASHPEARVCMDPGCCQGYLSPEERTARWGADQPAYEKRILTAVQETEGLILTYEGRPITMVYHGVSGGRTEDARQVFGRSLPYLVSVDSPGEEGSARFETRTRMDCEEAARRLNEAFPQARVQGEMLSAQLALREVSPAGRALTVQVGDQLVTGREFRQALDLASTWISLECDDAALTILQRGYGHGVGMSQAGANAMAARGSPMAQILAHYYPGTQLQPMHGSAAGGER